MAGVTVTARGNPAGVHALVSDTGDVGRWFHGLIRRAESRAKLECPVDTGNMRRTINSEVQGAGTFLRGIIRAETSYALAVHQGAAPHEIRPVRARALRFTVGGDVVYATKVNHPGNAANPFLRRALFAVVGGL